MTSSEDFKQAIRAGNISEAFLVAMSNAPELSITTRIITADGYQSQSEQTPPDNYLSTHINLIEGKIENEIGVQLTGDRYREIKQFHLQQVTQGHQTIQHNLISLQKMFQLMSSFEELQAAGRSSWVDIAADVARESLPEQDQVNQLYSTSPNALNAGQVSSLSNLHPEDNGDGTVEPRLPSLASEDDDEIVNDLLSLTDLDDEAEEPEHDPEARDWSQWIEDESGIKSEVFDLKSLNIRDATKNWQDWESPDGSAGGEAPD